VERVVSITIDGAGTVGTDLDAQAARLRDPSPALEQAYRELADMRARNRGWNRPPVWLRRLREILERYVVEGSLR
jgi:hypothetical protein